MKVSIFTLNAESLEVAEKIANCSRYRSKIFQGKEGYGSLGELVASIYEDYDGLVFIMATGIVVRIIAPLLKNKALDPAILVIDPQGTFVISLLAGHLGGANRLTKEIAKILKAQPVITTATDVLGKKSLEDWAQYHGLGIKNIQGLVKINGALVKDENITIYSELNPQYFADYPLGEKERIQFLPLKELEKGKNKNRPQTCVGISRAGGLEDKVDLELIIRNLVVGIGCRRDTPQEKLQEFLEEVFLEAGLSLANIKKFVSIDIKKEEKGLIGLVRSLRLPIEFFTPKQLASVFLEHPDLNYSKFVQKTIGVGGVCEPAALLGSKQGTLIVKKKAREGMTIAIAEEKLPLWG